MPRRFSFGELQVLDLLERGASIQEISVALSRSPKTIAAQIESLKWKADVSTRADLLPALREGLLDANVRDYSPT